MDPDLTLLAAEGLFQLGLFGYFLRVTIKAKKLYHKLLFAFCALTLILFTSYWIVTVVDAFIWDQAIPTITIARKVLFYSSLGSISILLVLLAVSFVFSLRLSLKRWIKAKS